MKEQLKCVKCGRTIEDLSEGCRYCKTEEKSNKTKKIQTIIKHDKIISFLEINIFILIIIFGTTFFVNLQEIDTTLNIVIYFFVFIQILISMLTLLSLIDKQNRIIDIINKKISSIFMEKAHF